MVFFIERHIHPLPLVEIGLIILLLLFFSIEEHGILMEAYERVFFSACPNCAFIEKQCKMVAKMIFCPVFVFVWVIGLKIVQSEA